MTEKLMNKTQLAEQVLNCDPRTAEKYYISQPSFPYIMEGRKKKFPLKQVEEWIKTNTRRS